MSAITRAQRLYTSDVCHRRRRHYRFHGVTWLLFAATHKRRKCVQVAAIRDVGSRHWQFINFILSHYERTNANNTVIIGAVWHDNDSIVLYFPAHSATTCDHDKTCHHVKDRNLAFCHTCAGRSIKIKLTNLRTDYCQNSSTITLSSL